MDAVGIGVAANVSAMAARRIASIAAATATTTSTSARGGGSAGGGLAAAYQQQHTVSNGTGRRHSKHPAQRRTNRNPAVDRFMQLDGYTGDDAFADLEGFLV
jgi:hypothetical protein